MKKHAKKRLALAKETVRRIAAGELIYALGGDKPDDGTGDARDYFTGWVSCYPGTC